MNLKMKWNKILTMLLVLTIACSTITSYACAAPKGYQFKYNGVTVSMNDTADTFIKKSGKVLKKTVKKSCAYKGKDRTYKFKNYILYTYSNSDNGTEYINGITFLNKKVATKEGIKIGSKLSAVQKKYGKTSEQFGIYTYTKGNSKLQIEVKNNKVTNIRYTMV